MRTRAFDHQFRERPWGDIAVFLDGLSTRHAGFAHMASIARSVVDEGAVDLLAGCTSMHDLLVVPRPIMDPPYDIVVVRAPGSIRPPSDGHVLIEHLSTTGLDGHIERLTSDAVPLFWRFMIEKFGVHPPRRTAAETGQR